MPALLRGSIIAVALGVGAAASGSIDADGAAIRSVALDYIEAFYTADPARLEHVLHPDVVRRHVTTDPRTHRSAIDSAGARALIERTRDGLGRSMEGHRRRAELTVLDRVADAAVVKIVGADSIDYLQMAKFDGAWKIIDVLWAPQAAAPSGGALQAVAAATGAPGGAAAPPSTGALPAAPAPPAAPSPPSTLTPRVPVAPGPAKSSPAQPSSSCSSRIFMLI